MLFLHWSPDADLSIDSLCHIVFIELLTSDVSIQDLWNILIRNVGMGDDVVQLVTLSCKWVSVTQCMYFTLLLFLKTMNSKHLVSNVRYFCSVFLEI